MPEALAVIGLILFSAFLSASEVALFSLNRHQLRYLRDTMKGSHERIRTLLADPNGLLVTLLCLIEVSNVTLASFMERKVHDAVMDGTLSILEGETVFEAMLGVLITAPVLLLLCEIIPKVTGLKINEWLAARASGPLWVLYRLLAPIRWLLLGVLRSVQGPAEKKMETEDTPRHADLMVLLEKGHKEGAIKEEEVDLVQNVLDMEQERVSSISTPWEKVIRLRVDASLRDALLLMKTKQLSRIPVCTKKVTEVAGVLYLKDLVQLSVLESQANLPVAEFMRKPVFVRSDLRLSALFGLFKRSQTHLLFVKDGEQRLTGVVTLHDLLDFVLEEALDRGLPPSEGLP
jgi:putative hemolysin